MAAGYGFGRLLELERSRRDRLLITIGLGLVALFLVLRLTNLYGDARLWAPNPRGFLYTALQVLNTTKYPPSLQYLLMTLGPALALIPLLERWRGALADRVAVFGRVPFFFYVLHLPLIWPYHALRALFAVLLLWWFFNLCALLTRDRRTRMLALALVAFSGGAGWLHALLPGFTFIDRPQGDLMMPEVSGIDLYRLLDPVQRERVVFMTGGAFTPQAREFLARNACPRLEKPFPEHELRDAIGRVTASRGTRRDPPPERR